MEAKLTTSLGLDPSPPWQ